MKKRYSGDLVSCDTLYNGWTLQAIELDVQARALNQAARIVLSEANS